MKCPQCGSTATIKDKQQGEKICTRCGLIILEKEMSKDPEWYSEPGKEKGRADTTTGSDITQHDLGLGTKMGKTNDLSPSWRAKLRRLQKWHKRARATNYQEKSLRQALINLDKLCEDLHLPKSVKAEVSNLFRKTRQENITPGRNTWAILTTLIFIVARMRKIPRTEKEIAKTLAQRTDLKQKESRKTMRRYRKPIAKKLDLEIPRPRPKEYLDRFTTKLELPKKVRREAHKICEKTPEKFKKRKASFLVAAAIVYNAGKKVGKKAGIREIANTLDVGVSSLSQTAQKIRNLQPETQE